MKPSIKRRSFWTGPAYIAALVAGSAGLAMPTFGDWSPVANIESLPGSSSDVNSASIEGCPSMSPDGLTLAFNSFRSGNQQIYLVHRDSIEEGFGAPEMLPAPINTPALEFCPTIMQGNRLYFSRAAGGDLGDIYVSKLGPKGWSTPERLGAAINQTGTIEEGVSIYEDDDGREVLLFSRRPPGPFDGVGGKIYQSVDGAPASLVAGGPHSSASDNRPSVTHDGKTIFWDSLRSGSLGGPDIWYATRSNTAQPFGSAVHLGALSSDQSDTRPYIGWRGDVLTFSSSRAGGEAMGDIWFATRSK